MIHLLQIAERSQWLSRPGPAPHGLRASPPECHARREPEVESTRAQMQIIVHSPAGRGYPLKRIKP